MKLHAPTRILAVAAVCAAALIALVVNEGAARSAGLEVRIPMAAVDPRALLSGHYVIVDMREPVAVGQACPAREDSWDWIALRSTGDGHHTLAGAAPSREEAQRVGSVPVKGSFTCSPPIASAAPGDPGIPGWVQIDVGINRFYINQTDAERIERVLREQRADEAVRAYAIVSVGRDGRGRLRGLEVDGERLELRWL
jgi:hypothetical protein